MGRSTYILLIVVIILSLPTAVKPQRTRNVQRTANKESKAVPADYTGTWVCQTGVPGQTMIHSSVNVITGTLEQTTTTTTPGVVAIKFNLKPDGTYEAPNARGHYSFDAATNAITWLDGLHHEKFTKTEIDRRPNGAPSMHFQMLQRYWGCFKSETGSAVKTSGTSTTKSDKNTQPGVSDSTSLANPNAPAFVAPVVSDAVSQLAKQAATIHIRGIPTLVQIAQLTISRSGRPPQNVLDEPTNNEVQSKFLRSNSWFKPWGWANEISKGIPWDDPTAPRNSGFARQQSGREKLTKLFSDCLDYYEQQARDEQYATNDLAVTYSHSIALNLEVSTGRKLTAREDLALRNELRSKISYYPYYFSDSSKQAIHEAMVITTILTQAGYAEATLNHDQQGQAAFRETARRNVETLKRASIDDLVHAGWGTDKN